jgi:DNA polymerase/3'-5' exonuclease PolX
MRQDAKSMGMKLNEYGLYHMGADDTETLLASDTEDSIFSAMMMEYIEPRHRK